MSDGTETLDQITPDLPASAEVETGSHATDNASNEVQDLDALTNTTEEGAPDTDDHYEAEEEYEEVERNGKKYRIPKALNGELMMQSDYTRKTQEVAETRKALEARQAELDQQAKAISALNEDRKKLVLAESTLERYEKINWQQLENDDPLEAGRRWREYQQWKDYKGKLEISVNEAEQQRALEEERTVATRVQDALNEAKKIPGWKDGETGLKIQAHAQATYGLEVNQIDALIKQYGAPIIKALHDGMIGRQLIQQKQTTAKAPAVAAEPVKPLAPVATRGASPAARKSLDAMSMEEYAAARKAGRAV